MKGLPDIRSNEQKHAAYRRPIQGAYSLSSLRTYEPAVDEMIDKLNDILNNSVKGGKPLNISSWCHYCTCSSLTVSVCYTEDC